MRYLSTNGIFLSHSTPMNDTLIFFLLNAPKSAERENEDTAASMVLNALKDLPKKCLCGNHLRSPFILA